MILSAAANSNYQALTQILLEEFGRTQPSVPTTFLTLLPFRVVIILCFLVWIEPDTPFPVLLGQLCSTHNLGSSVPYLSYFGTGHLVEARSFTLAVSWEHASWGVVDFAPFPWNFWHESSQLQDVIARSGTSCTWHPVISRCKENKFGWPLKVRSVSSTMLLHIFLASLLLYLQGW